MLEALDSMGLFTKHQRFSEIEALTGFLKVYKSYRSVINNEDRLRKKGVFEDQMRACDRMHKNWINLQTNRKDYNPYFYNSLSFALQALVNEMEKEKSGHFAIISNGM